MSQPQEEEPYQLPGTEAAAEPQSLIDHPLMAQDVPALIPKLIG
jgi:hypothetical protein